MNQLGDMLFSLPTLEAARREFPSAKIYSVINKNLSEVLEASGFVDGVIVKDAGLKINLIKNLITQKFNKAVLFSESPTSLISAFACGAKERVGFESSSLNFLLTQKVKRTGVPSSINNARLAAATGIKHINPTYEGLVKVPEESMLKVKQWFEKNNIAKENVVAFSVGASKRRAEKCLQNKVWTEVLNVVGTSREVPVLVGAAWEAENLNALADSCKKKPKVFIAQNVLESAAFFKSAKLFCGIDSGAMHLAAAQGTKCVAVFGPTDPEQVGPQPLHKHVIIQKQKNINDIFAKDIILAVLDNI
jgi:ADP-heptose:LPS heptosyltransferase